LRVFITGASSGLGEALARYYAARGAVLGLVARREDQLRHLVASLPGDGHRIYPLDVTDADGLAAAGRDFIATAGLPDVVIANAGISVGTLTQEAGDRAAFQRVFAVNVVGVVNTFHPFVAPMEAAGSGRLVGIASVAGMRGLPGAGAYSSSKAAVIKYLESLRVELRGSGVQVCTLCPGYIATPMTAINPYRMPFLMQADDAARRMADAIDQGVSYKVIPWQMAIAARAMRMMPNFVYDLIFSRAGRKPRNLDL
jgi:short-subunit dehydrogenase